MKEDTLVISLKDRLALLFIGFFGIGYLPKFSKITTIIVSSLIMLLPCESEYPPGFWAALAAAAIYVPVKLLFSMKIIKEKPVDSMSMAISIWIILSSPYIYYSIGWIVASILIYYVIIEWSYYKKLCSSAFGRFIRFDRLLSCIAASIATLLCIHTIYAGYRILPLLIMFFRS